MIAPRAARSLVAAQVAASAVSLASEAHGQTAAETRYNAILQRGRQLHAARDHAGALRAFRSAQTPFTGMPAELLGYIAQEEMETRQVAQGIRDATECICRGDTDPSQPRIADTLARCEQLLVVARTELPAALGVRIASVRIVAPRDAGPDLVIRVAGQEIPRRLWDGSYPVIAGRVRVEISAANADPVIATVTLAAGGTQVIRTGVTETPSQPPPPANEVRVASPVPRPVESPTATESPRIAGVGAVVVEPDEAIPGLGISIGGYDFSRPWWNRPFPVREGRVVIEAEAPGRERVRREVDVGAGRDVPVRLSLPRIGTGELVAPTARVSAPRRGVPWAAPGLVGLGGAALLGGLASYAVSESNRATLDASCDPGGRTNCDPALADLETSGRRGALAGNILVVAGGIVAAAGGIWWIVDRVRSTPVERLASAEGSR